MVMWYTFQDQRTFCNRNECNEYVFRAHWITSCVRLDFDNIKSGMKEVKLILNSHISNEKLILKSSFKL